MSTTLVVNGGPPGVVPTVPVALRPVVAAADRVVAVDSGCDAAHRLGLVVDLCVGDLDSVSTAGLRRARENGAVVVQYPADKDRTDVELALELVAERARVSGDGDGRVVVLGTAAGRVDHLLATVGAVASEPVAGLTVDLVLDQHHLVVVGPGRRVVPAPVGSTVSLLALTADTVVRSTEGLRWPLHDERLDVLGGRGVSNVVDDAPASVEVATGRLLVVVPGTTDDEEVVR